MDEQKKEKKKLSRNQSAIYSILSTIGISGVFGAFFAAIVSLDEWKKFPESWLPISVGMLLLFGGFIVGGVLTLIFQKWDEDFCGKAGHILWYGTIGGGFVMSWLTESEVWAGTFVTAFIICLVACTIVEQWGKGAAGKEMAKDSLLLVLGFVAFAYVLNIRNGNIREQEAEKNEKVVYESAYQAGYKRGQEVQEEEDTEKYCYEGRSIYDIEESVLDYYGITPAEAWHTIDEYNFDASHGGITWDEYQNAIQAAFATAGQFPE